MSRDRWTQAEYLASECTIAWNPCLRRIPNNASPIDLPVGVLVGPGPGDDPRPLSHWSSRFLMWDRCMVSPKDATAWLFIKAMHLIVRDGVPAADVHREFLKIAEYRDGLSDDFPGIGTPLREDPEQ